MNIFPDPQRQSEIQFIYAKKLAYHTRMRLVALLIFGGLIVQFLFHFWSGLLFLFAGTLLSLVKGYANQPEVERAEEWNQVTPDEYQKVKQKQKELAQWDLDAFDISNPLGFTFFAGLAIFCFFAYRYFFMHNLNRYAAYWAWDALVLFLPHWFSGVKTYLKKDRLIIKINLLEEVMEMLAPPSDIQVLPMLATQPVKEKSERAPADARLMVKILNAPEHFLGLQVQIAINSVQGTDYPYLYCVLIAKAGTNFFKKDHPYLLIPPHDVILEPKTSGDVDILVVRQQTSTSSGYHTNIRAALHIVDSALIIARKLINP
ncbi:MAG: hypothetical protein V1727_03620 [Candidatus Omnitrophota bacterium]